MAQLPFASGPEKTFVPENTDVLEKIHIPENTRVPENTLVLERIVPSVARPVGHAVPSLSLCGLRRRGEQCIQTHFPLAYSLSCHIPLFITLLPCLASQVKHQALSFLPWAPLSREPWQRYVAIRLAWVFAVDYMLFTALGVFSDLQSSCAKTNILNVYRAK